MLNKCYWMTLVKKPSQSRLTMLSILTTLSTELRNRRAHDDYRQGLKKSLEYSEVVFCTFRFELILNILEKESNSI